MNRKIHGCSLKIHRVEISVVDGKHPCGAPCRRQHFDCVKANSTFENELNTA